MKSSDPGRRRDRRLCRRAPAAERRRRHLPGPAGAARAAGARWPGDQEHQGRHHPEGEDGSGRRRGRAVRRRAADLQGLRSRLGDRGDRARGRRQHHGRAAAERHAPHRCARRQVRRREGRGRPGARRRGPVARRRDPAHQPVRRRSPSASATASLRARRWSSSMPRSRSPASTAACTRTSSRTCGTSGSCCARWPPCAA